MPKYSGCALYDVTSDLYWADGVYWRLGILVGESRTTLTTLESERIEPLVLRDPRVRFALFRGTVDAPLLQTTAFEAATLEAQLEIASCLTRAEFVSELEDKVVLNPLFSWHKQEFGDFHTWFKSRGIDYEAAKQFSSDVYDDLSGMKKHAVHSVDNSSLLTT